MIEYQTINKEEAMALRKLGFKYKKNKEVYEFIDSIKLEEARKICQK